MNGPATPVCRSALLRYGRHDPDCACCHDSMWKPRPQCTCGFDTALQESVSEVTELRDALAARQAVDAPDWQLAEVAKSGCQHEWRNMAHDTRFDYCTRCGVSRLSAPIGTPPADSHAFKNFHRLLCERFDYAHDEVDWRRDQISLIEHIARRLAAVAPAGTVLVPREPTKEMLEADCGRIPSRLDVWRGMVAAAPTPPATAGKESGDISPLEISLADELLATHAAQAEKEGGNGR